LEPDEQVLTLGRFQLVVEFRPRLESGADPAFNQEETKTMKTLIFLTICLTLLVISVKV